ncbi:hypothetical protein [Rhizobium sp. F40D2]|uniref:hypothetical protein n=1 Tax=Rhizobium sp. F40D2 TaxID=3453141 RepID=UPI003F270BAF
MESKITRTREWNDVIQARKSYSMYLRASFAVTALIWIGIVAISLLTLAGSEPTVTAETPSMSSVK